MDVFPHRFRHCDMAWNHSDRFDTCWGCGETVEATAVIDKAATFWRQYNPSNDAHFSFSPMP